MRPIRFRAWCPETKRLFYIESLAWDDNWKIDIIEGFDQKGNACSIWNAEPRELMQFTGLFDKNGKRIFEGDILIFKGDNGLETLYEVYYNEAAAGFKVTRKAKHNKLIGPKKLTIEQMNLCEIVGNIFENGELLK